MQRDPGAAAERTVLAWQRTALALIAGAAILGRLQADTIGPLVGVPLGLAAGLAIWMLVRTRRGSDRHDGLLPLAAALATGLLAGTELLAVTA